VKLQIGKLRHRIVLCSQKYDVKSKGELLDVRESVIECWAQIRELAHTTFSEHGAAVLANRDVRTHFIYTRYFPLLDISGKAYVYEERMKSSPRWFKVLSVGQSEVKGSPYFVWSCRIVGRSDNVQAPDNKVTGPAQNMPQGVQI